MEESRGALTGTGGDRALARDVGLVGSPGSTGFILFNSGSATQHLVQLRFRPFEQLQQME
jgi:hypothetical protein